jgi:hypothetical protein
MPDNNTNKPAADPGADVPTAAPSQYAPPWALDRPSCGAQSGDGFMVGKYAGQRGDGVTPLTAAGAPHPVNLTSGRMPNMPPTPTGRGNPFGLPGFGRRA